MQEDCLKEIRCENCHHLTYVRPCDVYEKEKEILEVKHKRIVETYMGENSYVSVAQRVDITNQDNKYRTLVEKLIQMEVNDWSKFQEHLKKLYLAKFYQAPTQQQIGNRERSNVAVQTKTHVGSTNPT